MADALKNFIPGPTVSIAGTTSTAAVALGVGPTSRKDVMIYNSGTTVAFFKFGVAGVTAAVTDTPIAPGSMNIFHANDMTHVAAIMGSGTATLYFTSGYGN